MPSVLSGLDPDPAKLPVASEVPGQHLHAARRELPLADDRDADPHLPAVDLRREARSRGAGVPDTARLVRLGRRRRLPPPRPARAVRAADCPQIDDAWGNFGREARRRGGGAAERDGRQDRAVRAEHLPVRRALIDDGRAADAVLPRTRCSRTCPYVYLPSGRRYAVDARLLRGSTTAAGSRRGRRCRVSSATSSRLGYTDAALGLLLRRLRETGVYDRALVIVTADHGVGFRLTTSAAADADEPRRDRVRAVVREAARPAGGPDRRRAGARTSTSCRRSRACSACTLAWRVDGRPLVGRRLARDGTVTVMKQDGSLRLGAALRRCASAGRARLAEQIATFGTGSLRPRLPDRAAPASSSGASSPRSRCSPRAPLRGRRSTAGTLLDSVDRAQASFRRSSRAAATRNRHAPTSRSR